MFPRGGASILTPLEQKQIGQQAKADAAREEAEFNTSTTTLIKKKTKSKTKGKKSADDVTGPEYTIKIESLNYKVGSHTPSVAAWL